MTLRLTGSTSGYTEINAPASAGNNTLLLPTGNGSNGQILGTDGAGNLSWVNGRMVLETKSASAVAAIDFTGIPSWAKRITVSFEGVVAPSSQVIVQLGDSGGLETSGHIGGMSTLTSTVSTVQNTGVGFIVAPSTGGAYAGNVEIVNSSGNIWVASSVLHQGSPVGLCVAAGNKGLSATLDRIRVTTVAGSSVFAAGKLTTLYEG